MEAEKKITIFKKHYFLNHLFCITFTLSLVHWHFRIPLTLRMKPYANVEIENAKEI
jgi:hypothetical protein